HPVLANLSCGLSLRFTFGVHVNASSWIWRLRACYLNVVISSAVPYWLSDTVCHNLAIKIPIIHILSPLPGTTTLVTTRVCPAEVNPPLARQRGIVRVRLSSQEDWNCPGQARRWMSSGRAPGSCRRGGYCGRPIRLHTTGK